jgi:hypothetical protein
VPVDRWQQAIVDGKTFLARWGDQAHALGGRRRTCSGCSPCRSTPSRASTD